MRTRKTVPIKAILLDLDGVLYIGNQIIAGAAQAVQHLRDTGLLIAGVTNTTTQAKLTIAKKLKDFGIPVHETDIYTPAAVAVQYIGRSSAKLYIRDSLQEDFQGIHNTDYKPEFIVMGDLGGEGYSPEVLRDIFIQVMAGSKLLALHKNRFWQKPNGLHLDLDPFVTAIEYATGKQATILGKPSEDFFHAVCSSMGVLPEQTLMIGDDIESDIGGAKQAGLKTALVQTGKYRAEFVQQTSIKADLMLPSIADLPDALNLLQPAP
jgi:HAD superfamily hydrolase (TIGR01458 family)